MERVTAGYRVCSEGRKAREAKAKDAKKRQRGNDGSRVSTCRHSLHDDVMIEQEKTEPDVLETTVSVLWGG